MVKLYLPADMAPALSGEPIFVTELADPGSGGRLPWGVGDSHYVLVMKLAKSPEGRSQEQHRVTALMGSQKSRQKPYWPPANLALILGKSFPFSKSRGLN